jgi:hypothetical protein
MPIVTKSELAAELSISRPRVSVFISRGMPTVGRSVDLLECCAWVVAHVDESRGDVPSIAVQRAREHLARLVKREFSPSEASALRRAVVDGSR